MKRLLILFALCLTSCSFPFVNTCKPKIKYIEKPIYIKCKIPEVPPANLEPIPRNATYPKKLEIILNNYLKLKHENQMLREAMKVCQ